MQRYRANTEKVVWRIVDGEAVVVHADTSSYYGLNGTATCIWEALVSRPLTREEIVGRVGAIYVATADVLHSDVNVFLTAAQKEALVVESTGASGHSEDEPRAGEARGARARYDAPSLSRFGELEKLVLSGE